MTRPRVLVLGGRTAIALQVCRALQRTGCDVVAADAMVSSITRFSRCVARFVRLPRPAADLPAWVAAVAAVVTAEHITLVVPTGEEQLWLSLAAASGRGLGVPVVGGMPIDTLARLHDKAAFQELVATAGLTPLDTRPATVAAVEALVQGHGRGIVKPRGQRFGRGVVVVDRDTPLSSDLVAGAIEDDGIVQPFVEGEERCGFVLAEHGVVRAAVVYLPRWRFPLGPSFGFTGIDDAAFVAAMTAIVRTHGLDGAFGFDAIQRPDGSLALLECNPRCTSGLHLLDDDTIAAALLRTPSSGASPASSPDASPASSSARGVGASCMVASAMVLCARPRSLAELWALGRDLWRSDDVVWDARDPVPSLAFVGVVFELALTARRAGIPARFATSHQLSWDPAAWPLSPAP